MLCVPLQQTLVDQFAKFGEIRNVNLKDNKVPLRHPASAVPSFHAQHTRDTTIRAPLLDLPLPFRCRCLTFHCRCLTFHCISLSFHFLCTRPYVTATPPSVPRLHLKSLPLLALPRLLAGTTVRAANIDYPQA